MAKHLQSEYRPGSAPTPSGRPSHRSRRRRRFPWGVAASVLIILIALVVFLLGRVPLLRAPGGPHPLAGAYALAHSGAHPHAGAHAAPGLR